MTELSSTDTARRVLVVDDDDENRSVLVEILQSEGYTVEQAASGEEGLSKIEHWKPELVLLDYNMPGHSGLDTLNVLRHQDNYVAVIFVTGNVDQDAVIDCLAAGADDYIRKPFNFRELLARVKVRFRNKDAQDALEAATQQLRELAEKDDVTGLYNMRYTYDKIDHELRRGRRFGRRVAVVMMDLDHFKSVNDEFDHLFGSFVLKEIGGIVKRSMREVDFAARYGGDEFLMVLTETEEAGVKIFADRLRQNIEKHVSTDGKNSFSRTASLGYAIFEATDEFDAKELVRRADHALYAAKETGRNRVVGYTPALDEQHGPRVAREDKSVKRVELPPRAAAGRGRK